MHRIGDNTELLMLARVSYATAVLLLGLVSGKTLVLLQSDVLSSSQVKSCHWTRYVGQHILLHTQVHC